LEKGLLYIHMRLFSKGCKEKERESINKISRRKTGTAFWVGGKKGLLRPANLVFKVLGG